MGALSLTIQLAPVGLDDENEALDSTETCWGLARRMGQLWNCFCSSAEQSRRPEVWEHARRRTVTAMG